MLSLFYIFWSLLTAALEDDPHDRRMILIMYAVVYVLYSTLIGG